MSDGGIKWMVSVWAKYYCNLLDSKPDVLNALDSEVQVFLAFVELYAKDGLLAIWLMMLLDFISMARESDDKDREFAKFFAQVNSPEEGSSVN